MPKKTDRNLLLYVAIAFIAIACSVIGHSWDAKGFWINILASVPIAGLAIMFGSLVVDRIAKRVEIAERIARQQQFHDGLSRLVTFVLEATEGNLFYWSKHVQHSDPLRNKLLELKAIKAQLDAKTYKLNVLQRKYVIEAAHTAQHTFRVLSPSAFELSSRQGIIWLGISKSVDLLASLFPYPGKKEPEARASEEEPPEAPPIEVDFSPRPVIFGEDTFSLAFCELIDQMLEFASWSPE